MGTQCSDHTQHTQERATQLRSIPQGYKYDLYTSNTADGYVLGLQRIYSTTGSTLGHVILQHGLLDTAATVRYPIITHANTQTFICGNVTNPHGSPRSEVSDLVLMLN